MNEERVNALVEAISAYDDKEKLLSMSPEEATKEINSAGYNFTVEEVTEMGKALVSVYKAVGTSGELDEEALEEVSGGLGTVGRLLLSGAQTLCTVIGAGLLYGACAAVVW